MVVCWLWAISPLATNRNAARGWCTKYLAATNCYICGGCNCPSLVTFRCHHPAQSRLVHPLRCHCGRKPHTPSFGQSLRAYGTGQEEGGLHGVAFSLNLFSREMEGLEIGVQLQSCLNYIHILYTDKYNNKYNIYKNHSNQSLIIVIFPHSICPIVSSSSILLYPPSSQIPIDTPQ
jgi:hypothetical protein